MTATAVVVAFGVSTLDTSHLSDDDPLIIVHNDDLLRTSAVEHENVLHIPVGHNVGFGAGVNLALPHVTTSRTVLLNPDLQLDASAWRALAAAGPHEIATIRLHDIDGTSTSVVAPYPTPASLFLTGFRLGRLLPRRVRWGLPAWLLGSWAAEQRDLAEAWTVAVPLSSHWVSGAAFSVETDLVRSVGGFDEQYFLYFEDVDLCARLAAAHHDLVATVLDHTGTHLVGGTQRDHGSGVAERHRLASAITYSGRLTGMAGRTCAAALRVRRRFGG